MAVGTTAAIIASAVIAAGSSAVSANQQKKSAGGRAESQKRLAARTRAGQVDQQKQEAQRARDVRAVEQATTSSIKEDQLATQGISDDFGTLDVGALGATSGDTAASTLNPIQPNTGG